MKTEGYLVEEIFILIEPFSHTEDLFFFRTRLTLIWRYHQSDISFSSSFRRHGYSYHMDITEEECLTMKVISFVIHDPDRFDFIEEKNGYARKRRRKKNDFCSFDHFNTKLEYTEQKNRELVLTTITIKRKVNLQNSYSRFEKENE